MAVLVWIAGTRWSMGFSFHGRSDTRLWRSVLHCKKKWDILQVVLHGGFGCECNEMCRGMCSFVVLSIMCRDRGASKCSAPGLVFYIMLLVNHCDSNSAAFHNHYAGVHRVWTWNASSHIMQKMIFMHMTRMIIIHHDEDARQTSLRNRWHLRSCNKLLMGVYRCKCSRINRYIATDVDLLQMLDVQFHSRVPLFACVVCGRAVCEQRISVTSLFWFSVTDCVSLWHLFSGSLWLTA